MDNNSVKKLKSDLKKFVIAKIYENIENNRNLFNEINDDIVKEEGEEMGMNFNEYKIIDRILSEMIKNRSMFRKVLFEVIKSYERKTDRKILFKNNL